MRRFLARASARIEKWNREHPNRQRATLPAFQLRDLRASNATEHYVRSHGDIRVAQQVLNHRFAQTTQVYIEGARARDVNVRIITGTQSELVDHISSYHKRISESQDGERRHDGASASFGNDCRSPTLPTIQGAPRLCPHFQQCLDCPGLVIPQDAKHLAMVLRAKRAFESARKRLHPERWEAFYAVSYRRLVKDIQPEFPKSLEPEAKTILASLPPLPELE